MASLELIHFFPHRIVVAEDGTVRREQDRLLRPIKGLPQIYWADGSSWRAANLWAFKRATNGNTDIKTVRSNLSHLHKYAKWLEAENLDWRHFPIQERDRVLILWLRIPLMADSDSISIADSVPGDGGHVARVS